jgi:tetratricopeptide (TPR) repeat protein
MKEKSIMGANDEMHERSNIDSTDPTSEHLDCPNCGALNPPDTVICHSCGVNIARFDALLPQMQDLQSEYATKHATQLVLESATQVAEEVQLGKARFKMQVRWFILILFLLVGIGSLLTFGYTHYIELRRARRAALYEKGIICLENGDFGCALVNLTKVAREDRNYSDVCEALRETRVSLWKRAVQEENWEEAVSLLEANLRYDPNDAQSARFLSQTYQRWLQSAAENRHWLTYLWVLLRRMLGRPRSYHKQSEDICLPTTRC